MPEILTRCGFRCDLCPAYAENIGKLADRESISDGWFKYFSFRIPPEKIDCDGCLNKGRLLDKDCPIRPCAIERGLRTCAACPDFDCEKMRTRVDATEGLRDKFPDMSQRDYQLFGRPYEGRRRLVRLREKGE
jgi:hypothetical protein